MNRGKYFDEDSNLEVVAYKKVAFCARRLGESRQNIKFCQSPYIHTHTSV